MSGEPIATFVDRVQLGSAGEANRAIERWKQLEREGWQVTALGATDGSHLIGLGYLPAPRAEERAS